MLGVTVWQRVGSPPRWAKLIVAAARRELLVREIPWPRDVDVAYSVGSRTTRSRAPARTAR
jgi:hypothetical protein